MAKTLTVQLWTKDGGLGVHRYPFPVPVPMSLDLEIFSPENIEKGLSKIVIKLED